MIITCNISGVPRTIQIIILITTLRGLNLLIAPKAISKPSGNANKSVNANIKQVVPKPCNKSSVISRNIINKIKQNT